EARTEFGGKGRERDSLEAAIGGDEDAGDVRTDGERPPKGGREVFEGLVEAGRFWGLSRLAQRAQRGAKGVGAGKTHGAHLGGGDDEGPGALGIDGIFDQARVAVEEVAANLFGSGDAGEGVGGIGTGALHGIEEGAGAL